MKHPATPLALVLLLSLACGPRGNGGQPPSGGRETGTALAANSQSLEEAEATIPAAWTMPEPAWSYNVRQGQALFRHYCTTCHGEEGHGDGFNAYSLDPKPRDLADAAFQAQQSDDDLASVIRLGGGVSGFSTAMPPWGRSLSARDIQNIILYIRVLPPSTE